MCRHFLVTIIALVFILNFTILQAEVNSITKRYESVNRRRYENDAIDMNYYDGNLASPLSRFHAMERSGAGNTFIFQHDINHHGLRRNNKVEPKDEFMLKYFLDLLSKEPKSKVISEQLYNLKDHRMDIANDASLMLRKRIKPVYIESHDMLLLREKHKDKVWAKYYYYGEPHCQIGTIWNIDCFACLCLMGGKSYCTNIGNPNCMPAENRRSYGDNTNIEVNYHDKYDNPSRLDTRSDRPNDLHQDEINNIAWRRNNYKNKPMTSPKPHTVKKMLKTNIIVKQKKISGTEKPKTSTSTKDEDLISRKRVKPIYVQSRDLLLYREKYKNITWAKYYYYGEPHCQIGTIWNIDCFACLCLMGGKSYCTNIGNPNCMPAGLKKDSHDIPNHSDSLTEKNLHKNKSQECTPGNIWHEHCRTCTCDKKRTPSCVRERNCAAIAPGCRICNYVRCGLWCAVRPYKFKKQSEPQNDLHCKNEYKSYDSS